MKKIITAMGDKYLNEKLKQEKFNVIGKDIQYIEGVFEQLEVQKDINVIIISTKLIKENKELIHKINLINKKIKIIIMIENKNIEFIKFLRNKKIKYYFNLNNKVIKYLFKYLKIEKVKINKNLKYKKYKRYKEEIKKISKIITIVGPHGVGKTVFTGIFSKMKKEKILIIDFDKNNLGLHMLYGVNHKTIKLKKEKQTKKIKYKTKNNNIIKINYYIDLLIYFNFKNNKEKINKMVYYYQKKYDYILIDIAFYIKNNHIKPILKNSDYIIFITEGNLLQLKKSKQLLDFYLKNWNIKKEKFNILLNKKNKKIISTEIIKNIFYDIKFLGEIKFNYNYDSLINNHLNNLILNPKIMKDYRKIIKKV